MRYQSFGEHYLDVIEALGAALAHAQLRARRGEDLTPPLKSRIGSVGTRYGNETSPACLCPLTITSRMPCEK